MSHMRYAGTDAEFHYKKPPKDEFMWGKSEWALYNRPAGFLYFSMLAKAGVVDGSWALQDMSKRVWLGVETVGWQVWTWACHSSLFLLRPDLERGGMRA